MCAFFVGLQICFRVSGFRGLVVWESRGSGWKGLRFQGVVVLGLGFRGLGFRV